MLSLVLAFAFKNWRAVAVVAAIAAFVTGVMLYRHALIMEGEQAALEKVNQANEKATNEADAASKAVLNCSAGGGVWNRTSGMCDKPAGQ